jgi:hypothetical protein
VIDDDQKKHLFEGIAVFKEFFNILEKNFSGQNFVKLIVPTVFKLEIPFLVGI